VQEDWACCLGDVKHGDENYGILVRDMGLLQRPSKDLKAGNQKWQGVLLN